MSITSAGAGFGALHPQATASEEVYERVEFFRNWAKLPLSQVHSFVQQSVDTLRALGVKRQAMH
jgi:hypothetical protein